MLSEINSAGNNKAQSLDSEMADYTIPTISSDQQAIELTKSPRKKSKKENV